MQGRGLELLAPAGGPAEFNAALAAGADAIYCGYGQVFNARRGAQSFDANTFGEACRKAHVAGARVYVTVNVAIRDDEMPNVLALVRRSWLLGADAFIIQDWGLLREVARLWPQVECHVSTQANVHDARGVLWCQEMGARRVTLSRELSLKEISHMATTGVELECFAHGAICFCYSGVCMMSSCGGDRSANRGMCAQPCRLPYELVDSEGGVLSAIDRGRPLCPKDMCTIDDVGLLLDAGVASLKVEGRLKGPDYVYAVTKTYRAQLDDALAGRETTTGEARGRHTALKRIFNRGFTDAYLMGTSGDELMSYERSNNRGELVGKVVESRSLGSIKVRRGGGRGGRERLRTTTVAEADVALLEPVGKGDLLELRPVSDPSQFVTTHAPRDAVAGECLRCRTSRFVEKGSLVRVIRSEEAMRAGARVAEAEIPIKRPIRARVYARLGEPFGIELQTMDGCAVAAVQGDVVQPARTRAVTSEDLIAHVGRMGGTPFEVASFEVELDDGVGMGFSAVHKLRARACEVLEQAIVAPYGERSLSQVPARDSFGTCVPAKTGEVEVCALVSSPEAAREAQDAGATRIYAVSDALGRGAWPAGVVPLLDEVCRESDHEQLDGWVRPQMPVAVGSVSELALACERGALAEVRGCIPVHNSVAAAALVERGAHGIWLSPELSLAEVQELAGAIAVPVGLMVLGRVRAMTSEHCVLQVADKCVHDCARCALRKRKLYLRSGAGEQFPVLTDLKGRSRVYACRPLDVTPQIPELLSLGVVRFGADCTLLSPAETSRSVKRVVRAVRAAKEGRRPDDRLPGASSGHLFAPIA